jgi:hypothetical protein
VINGSFFTSTKILFFQPLLSITKSLPTPLNLLSNVMPVL